MINIDRDIDKYIDKLEIISFDFFTIRVNGFSCLCLLLKFNQNTNL